MPQLCPEIAGEPGVLVTNYFARNTKKTHYLVKEELGTLWGTKCTLFHKTMYQANVFSNMINTSEDRIEAEKKW